MLWVLVRSTLPRVLHKNICFGYSLEALYSLDTIFIRYAQNLKDKLWTFYGKLFYYLLSKIDICYIISDILYRK